MAFNRPCFYLNAGEYFYLTALNCTYKGPRVHVMYHCYYYFCCCALSHCSLSVIVVVFIILTLFSYANLVSVLFL